MSIERAQNSYWSAMDVYNRVQGPQNQNAECKSAEDPNEPFIIKVERFGYKQILPREECLVATLQGVVNMIHNLALAIFYSGYFLIANFLNEEKGLCGHLKNQSAQAFKDIARCGRYTLGSMIAVFHPEWSLKYEKLIDKQFPEIKRKFGFPPIPEYRKNFVSQGVPVGNGESVGPEFRDDNSEGNGPGFRDVNSVWNGPGFRDDNSEIWNGPGVNNEKRPSSNVTIEEED